jgi:hypothetical protein
LQHFLVWQQVMVENKIHVQIKIFSWFSGVLIPGHESALLLDEELTPGSSLRTCFRKLNARFTRFQDIIYNVREDSLQIQVVLTYNGKLLTGTNCMDLELRNGDSICLIPAYAGG